MENKINITLSNYINQLQIPAKSLKQAMLYTLNGGKRFRPSIMGFLAQQTDVDEEHFINIACALEMIHSYTLAHDDLPSMDNDDIRRGQPSLHKKFNEYTAILAGDALQSEAFYILTTSETIPCNLQLQIANLIASNIGAKNLISGQVLDLEFNKIVPATLLNLQKIHLLKTAKLIALPLIIVAMLAYKDKLFIERITSYGEKLGIMFQIADDLSDIQEDGLNIVNFMGKPATLSLLKQLDYEAKQILKLLNLNPMNEINQFILETIDV